MSTETIARDALTQDTKSAAEFFEKKLAFEVGPIGLKYAIKEKAPVTIVDLRTPELFALSHVPGAINLDFDQIDNHLSTLSKDKTTIVYCYNITCNLSAKAALHLAKKGYPVKELVGGFESWVEAELPVEGKEAKGSPCGTSCC